MSQFSENNKGDAFVAERRYDGSRGIHAPVSIAMVVSCRGATFDWFKAPFEATATINRRSATARHRCHPHRALKRPATVNRRSAAASPDTIRGRSETDAQFSAS